jgi:cobyrinic acid a,c-diamide synthase
MIVTKRDVVEMLLKYINREIDLPALVNWAEEAIKEADFETENFELIRDIVSRIGLSDVREFGLTWDDCYDYLHRLGYDVKVELLEAKQ